MDSAATNKFPHSFSPVCARPWELAKLATFVLLQNQLLVLLDPVRAGAVQSARLRTHKVPQAAAMEESRCSILFTTHILYALKTAFLK
jgi:hypothetical protein